MARDAFHIEVQNYVMACKPSLSRQPSRIGLRKLSKTVFFYFGFKVCIFNIIFNHI